MNIDKKIKDEINKIKPFLIADGGDIDFIKFENGIVYVDFLGECVDCPMMDVTLKNGIEEVLINTIPEVIKVEAIKKM